MWILNFIPDALILWAINIILLVGLTAALSSNFISYVPSIIPYASIIKIVGIVLLVVGIYMRGGYDVESSWRSKVEDLEAKINISEVKSKEVNTVLKDSLISKNKEINQNQVLIQERIKKVNKQIDADCKITPEVITILNDAARNIK
jgi:hypothetical protein